MNQYSPPHCTDCSLKKYLQWRTTRLGQSPFERGTIEGESHIVSKPYSTTRYYRELDCLGMQIQLGGKLCPKLNTGESPIVNKYCENSIQD